MYLNKLEQHEQSEENRPFFKLLEKIAVYIDPKKLGNLLLMGAMLSTPSCIQAKSIEVENATTTTPSVSVVVPDLRPIFEGTATQNAPQATLTAMAEEILQTPQATPSPAEMAVQDMPAEEMAALPIEEQKKIIEANYDGGIVHEAIVMDEETLIFFDGKEWQELSALWGFNDEPVPWGEVYTLDNTEDLIALKEIVGKETSRAESLDSVSKVYSTMKFVSFYPNNDSWEFQGDSNKPAYATFELSGYFVFNIDRKIVVIEATTSPARTIVLYQEGSSGQFSTMQISEGNGLAPSLVGIEPRTNFELDASGRSLLYMTDLTDEDIKDWLGAEDLDPENIEQFIKLLKEDQISVIRPVIHMGTIADKE